jgi:hypothetical protein
VIRRALGRRQRAAGGNDGTPPGAGDPPHVFDQTNGVLGEDADRPESAPQHDAHPPTSFGVPPITSL